MPTPRRRRLTTCRRCRCPTEMQPYCRLIEMTSHAAPLSCTASEAVNTDTMLTTGCQPSASWARPPASEPLPECSRWASMKDLPYRQAFDRIRAEYLEMPGMRLTPAQVERLSGVDVAICALVLDDLARAQFLHKGLDGSYSRAAQERPRSRVAKAELNTTLIQSSRRASLPPRSVWLSSAMSYRLSSYILAVTRRWTVTSRVARLAAPGDPAPRACWVNRTCPGRRVTPASGGRDRTPIDRVWPSNQAAT